MARLFRDLKVNEQDGKVYLTLYNRDGSPALRDVSVGVSSEVTQPGDNWTAAAANLLLRLDEEDQPQLALTPQDIGAAAAENGMSLYVHQKSGTVHTLTGSGDNLRFVATADFAAGDTIQVNGQACTAATAAGDALWNGFFRSGAVVVCYRTGNALTFNGGGLPAAEAAKLAPGNLKSGVSITANGKTVNGTFTADGTVAANQMLAGVVGYAKGRKVTGSIPSKGATSFRPGTASQTIAAGQYLSGAQTIEGDANLLAANIRQGTSIFGVAGTLKYQISHPEVLSFNLNAPSPYPTPTRTTVTAPASGNYRIQVRYSGHDSDRAGKFNVKIGKNESWTINEYDNYDLNGAWTQDYYCNAGDQLMVEIGGYSPKASAYIIMYLNGQNAV